MKSSNNYKKNTNRGFTLIELMVTIIIMMIMTSVVIFNYNRFNESSLLNALAYDLSLTIRQAQVYGTAVRENNSSLGPITTSSFDSFKSAYGVRFDVTSNKIILFADNDVNGYYGSGDTPLNTYILERGIKIKQLCWSADCLPPATTLDITFTRPNPEAKVIINDDNNNVANIARIVLQNADESIKKSVVVYSTGQISVQ